MTNTQAVLDALRHGGWVCGRVLHSPEIGGWRADARLHELRSQGHAIAKRLCDCPACRRAAMFQQARGRQPSRVHAWKLVGQLSLSEAS